MKKAQRLILLLLLLSFLCGCGQKSPSSSDSSLSADNYTADIQTDSEPDVTCLTGLSADTFAETQTDTRETGTEKPSDDTAAGADTRSGTETAQSAESNASITTAVPESTDNPGSGTETSRQTENGKEKSTDTNKTGKIRIGISGMDNSNDLANYITAVKKAGCEPVILKYVKTTNEARALLDTVDALVMTGGEDIDPVWYGEKKLNSSIKINAARDTSDILLICEAISRNMPSLCICRGMQILNVACGGSLYQDIPSQLNSPLTHRDKNLAAWKYHTITTEADSLVRSILGEEHTVNSWHHQAVKEAGANIRITARTSDGIVEAIELTDKSFIVGVQFHPEYYTAMGDRTFLKFFTALANAAS